MWSNRQLSQGHLNEISEVFEVVATNKHDFDQKVLHFGYFLCELARFFFFSFGHFNVQILLDVSSLK